MAESEPAGAPKSTDTMKQKVRRSGLDGGWCVRQERQRLGGYRRGISGTDAASLRFQRHINGTALRHSTLERSSVFPVPQAIVGALVRVQHAEAWTNFTELRSRFFLQVTQGDFL